MGRKNAVVHDNSSMGFSLVELIVVVAILGIIAAIAVPIVNGIQDRARENALHAIAAEGATGAAAQISNEEDPNDSLVADVGYRLEWLDAQPAMVDQVCVKATRLDTNEEAISGPGCPMNP